MTPRQMKRIDELETVLLGLDEVRDCVAVHRAAVDGRTWTVIYFVPAGGPVGGSPGGQAGELAGERARRVAAVAGRSATGPVAVVPVRRVPRSADGAPDLGALADVPVLTADTLRACAAEWRVGIEPAPVEPDVSALPIADRDADPGTGPGTGGRDTSAEAAGVPAPSDAPPALAEGPALHVLPDDPETVTQAILESAERFPEIGVRIVSRDVDTFMGYPELLRRGRRVLGGLRAHGLRAGDHAILVIPSLTEYVPAVWACLLGGVTCVTVSAPASFETPSPVLDKLLHAWRALGRPAIVTDDATAAAMAGLADRQNEPALVPVRVSDLEQSPESDDVHHPDPSDVAVLALSSGSTGTPKVIQVTHRAIVRNALSSRQVDLIRPGETSFNWLPFDHVAPLVMYLLRDVVLGCSGIHAPTSTIAEQPLRWLDVLAKYRVEHTWSANFAYRLVAEALRDLPDDPERRPAWDLSGVRTMLNAGEQCTPPVIREFVARTAPYGISDETIVHMWGMAETATGATCKFFATPRAVRRIDKSSLGGPLVEAGADAPAADVLELMSMGPPAPGADVRVVGEDGAVLPEGTIGRFQVRSDRVTPGYLNNPKANAEAFTADGWFDTGDLAFLLDGEVVISGRAKELIVISGEKYYCHEIEDVCGGLEGVAAGRVAACGVPDPASGTEVLAIFFVPATPAGADTGPLLETIDRIRAAVAKRIRLTATHVLPITEAEFPRTTSGKIQRAALVRRMAAGDFDELARSLDRARGTGATVPRCVTRPVWRATEPRPTGEPALAGITLIFADDLGLADALPGVLPGTHAIVVRPGGSFARLPSGREYLIDPDSPGDWTALRDDLAARELTPGTLLYLWSYLPTPDPAARDRDEVAAAVDRCGRHLVSACRTLLGPGTRLLTVSRALRRATGDEAVCYPAAQTPVIGATAARELPDVTAAHVDLAGADPAADARDLLAALRDRALRDGEIAWRDGRPYTRELAPVDELPGGRDAVVRGGRYLVTGGAGDVAETVVSALAERYGARFLLVGRRPADALAAPPPAYADYRAVDVCDAAALERAVAEAEAEWGAPLDGVLHLADSFRFRPLAEEDPADWDHARTPKVGGLLNVLDVVRRRPGARLTVFSSLLGHVSAAGCAAYGAGNAFADALIEHTGGQAQSLAWGLWHGLGLNRDNPYESAVVRRGVLSLTAEQGRLLARFLLRQPGGVYYAGLNPASDEVRPLLSASEELALVHAVMVPGDEPAPAQTPTLVDPFGVRVAVARRNDETDPAGDGDSGDALSPAERRALDVLADVFGAYAGRRVTLGDQLYEYGLGSIQMLQIHARLEAALGFELPRAALFEQPTIRDLVRLIGTARQGTAPAAVPSASL